MSICNDSLRELSNPGASGSLFFLTNDDEFILKTVMHKESEFLQKLLPGYYMNLNQNPHTLLPKFFGMFCYQCNQKNIRLTVMNNLLPSDVKMHLKFDLKGSTYKRKVGISKPFMWVCGNPEADITGGDDKILLAPTLQFCQF